MNDDQQPACPRCTSQGIVTEGGRPFVVEFEVPTPTGVVLKQIRGAHWHRCSDCGLVIPPWDAVHPAVLLDSTPLVATVDGFSRPAGISLDPVTADNHAHVLRFDVEVWNQCRSEKPAVRPLLKNAYLGEHRLAGAHLADADLAGANLAGSDLSSADLARADLAGANLSDSAKVPMLQLDGSIGETQRGTGPTRLSGATLDGANLTEANLARADLSGATMQDANLTDVCLAGANLSSADLSRANLTGVDLTGANLSGAVCRGAVLTGCRVHGVSTWDIDVTDAEQSGLIVTPLGDAEISVDGIELAQFIYLITQHKKLRDVIDTVTGKAVLVLGNFVRRKPVLDQLASELRALGYIPILFDFEPPLSQSLMETVATLAHLSGLVVCDATDPRSAPAELAYIAPRRHAPIVVVIKQSDAPVWGMLKGLRADCPWVLAPYEYASTEHLLALLRDRILPDVEQEAARLRELRASE